MAWNNVLPSYTVGSINIPPNGCFTSGPFLSKASFQSCQITLQHETGSSAPALAGSVSRNQIAPEVQMALNNDWTASIAPSGQCLSRVRTDFVSGRGNISSRLGNAMLQCMGIKRKWGIADGIELTISCSPDPHLCFFGVQISVEGIIGPFNANILGVRHRCRIQIQASLTIRFNLSPSGWSQLIRWVGTRALSAVSRVSGGAARIIACLTVTTAVIVVGTVICTALLVAGMAYLISDARRRGEARVHAFNYATGYVDALIRPELTRTGYQNAIDQYRGHPATINGYVDAIHNAMEFGYRRTRIRLLTVIGMNGQLYAEGPGRRRFPYHFDGNRFPCTTRNNLIGALHYRIEYGEARAITVPLWITD